MSKREMMWGMAVIFCGLILALPSAGAGNRKLIEKRIAELDQVNQQVVGRLPDLPKDGQVTFRGRVFPDGTVLGAAWVRTGAQASFPLFDDAAMISLGDAIRRHTRHSGRMGAYRDANMDRAYTPLAEGLRQRYAKDRGE